MDIKIIPIIPICIPIHVKTILDIIEVVLMVVIVPEVVPEERASAQGQLWRWRWRWRGWRGLWRWRVRRRRLSFTLPSSFFSAVQLRILLFCKQGVRLFLGVLGMFRLLDAFMDFMGVFLGCPFGFVRRMRLHRLFL